MKTRLPPVFLLLLVSPGCVVCNLAKGSSVDRTEAQKVSDSFMAHLANGELDEALALMEPDFAKSVQPGEVEKNVQRLFEFCGRPIEYQLNHDEIGVRMYLDGRTKPMRKFFYDGATTANPRGVCIYSVEIVPGEKDLRVASFGPLKRNSGKRAEGTR